MNLARDLAAPQAAASTSSSAVTLAALLAALGARLRFLYEVGVSAEQLNAGNFAQLNDLGPGQHHATAAGAAQPSKSAAGPNGRSCVVYQDVARMLFNTSLSIPSDRALTFLALTQAVPGAARTQFAVYADAAGTANPPFASFTNATNFQGCGKTHAGALEVRTFTVPPPDSQWRLWVQRYAAGVAPVLLAGTAPTAPLYTAAGRSGAVESVCIGGSGTAGGGGFYLAACVEDFTAAEETLVRQYIYQQTAVS